MDPGDGERRVKTVNLLRKTEKMDEFLDDPGDGERQKMDEFLDDPGDGERREPGKTEKMDEFLDDPGDGERRESKQLTYLGKNRENGRVLR
ncbi:hypothetical protein RRG08_063825 [Elysia crispata]|uniref:Uncharacterized protein n=2 Tax=Elysia crispata TaxID=231223 RepID=A0AAE0XZY4_9GAST|nr:hypothetical protein RRG08_063825 [Elysia crispata]